MQLIKFFPKERLQILTIPYWYQPKRWVIFLWRHFRCFLWKKGIWRYCFKCDYNLKKGDICKRCGFNHLKYEIPQVSNQEFIIIQNQVRNIKPLDKTENIDADLLLIKNIIEKEFDEISEIKTDKLLRNPISKLKIKFSKFPIIESKDYIK